MTTQYYSQAIDTAFAGAPGDTGASRERFAFWLESLAGLLPNVLANPPKEAEPVFSLPGQETDLAEIETIAKELKAQFRTLVVVGMGGSSLSGETLTAIAAPGSMSLRFIDNIDPHTIQSLLQTLNWQDTAFLIVSKSGNTVETLALLAVLLRHAKNTLVEYAKHFFAITIPDGNPLHGICQQHGIRVAAHDSKLGGRFSILSSVGLIPAAAAGLDIRALRRGAQAVLEENFLPQPGPAVQSAALHMASMEKHIPVQVMMPYCDRLATLATWYRQCWSESLGKNGKGTLPVAARGTTDQHSQLQLYLDGPKDKLFTVLMLETQGLSERIDYADSSDNRLAFLGGHTLGELMAAEQRATVASLLTHKCPVRSFTLKTLNEETLGALLMHFMLEVIFTAQLLKINAFDQPAVEQSKLFALQYLSEDTKLSST